MNKLLLSFLMVFSPFICSKIYSQELFPFGDGIKSEVRLTSIMHVYSKGNIDKTGLGGEHLPFEGKMVFGKKKFELTIFDEKINKKVFGIYLKLTDAKHFEPTSTTSNKVVYKYDYSSDVREDFVEVMFQKTGGYVMCTVTIRGKVSKEKEHDLLVIGGAMLSTR
jgi:hypothetical protein